MTRYLLFVAMIFLSACASREPTSPVPESLNLIAGPDINQTDDVANPVVVRVYQLSNRTEFDAANFWQIYNNDSAELAAVTLDKQFFAPLYPQEHRPVMIDLQPTTKYLGAFAEFANYRGQLFSTTIPVSPKSFKENIAVTVNASGIAIGYLDKDYEAPEEAEINPTDGSE